MDISDYVIVFNTIAFFISPFLFKHYIPAYLQKKAENLATKQDIEDITNKIESVKLLYEKNLLKFTTYHQKQSEVISKLYGLLSHSVYDLKKYSMKGMIDNEITGKIKNGMQELNDYYLQHKIFLPQDLKLNIEKIIELMSKSFMRRNFASDPGLDPSDKSYLIINAYKNISDQAEPLFEELEAELRKILSS